MLHKYGPDNNASQNIIKWLPGMKSNLTDLVPLITFAPRQDLQKL